MVVELEMPVGTIVVPADAVGAAPFPLDKEGVPKVERNNIYPIVVAPLLGKVAPVQFKTALPQPVVVPQAKLPVVGGLERV